MPVPFLLQFQMPAPLSTAHIVKCNVIARQKELSEFEVSWLLSIVPFNIGPKHEFVSRLVQNSPKHEHQCRSNTV